MRLTDPRRHNLSTCSRISIAPSPPTGTAATFTPAGLAPPSSRASTTTCPAARPPCGARPARPLAARATSFARRVVSKPGQAQQASRHPPVRRLLPPGSATTHRHRSHTTDAAATPASAANPPSEGTSQTGSTTFNSQGHVGTHGLHRVSPAHIDFQTHRRHHGNPRLRDHDRRSVRPF